MPRCLLCVLTLILMLASAARAETIRVSVAISLKEAVTEIAQAYQADHPGDEVTFAFGSSGQLATQIKNGAEVDLFISAAAKQVDDLAKEGMVESASQVIAQNHLVLIVPAGAANPPTSFEDLSNAAVKKVAIGEPKTVPAGDYAMQVLTALGVTGELKERLVYGTNVRQVLTYVEKSEVTAGIVYATDAQESGAKVKVVATAKPETHQPIVYPAAIVKASKHHDAAARFLSYLKTDRATKILMDKGFVAGEAAPATAPAK